MNTLPMVMVDVMIEPMTMGLMGYSSICSSKSRYPVSPTVVYAKIYVMCTR